MAIDRTGIDSLNIGAPDITYSGNQGPMEMAEWEGSPGMDSRPEVQEAWKDFLEYRKNGGDKNWKQYKPIWIRANLASRGDAQNRRMASAPHPDESWLGLWEDLREKGEVPESIRNLQEFKNWFHNQDFDIDMSQRNRSGIMQAAYGGTARPTYTQSRKQRMAYGGIAGLDGRKRYGIGSWFQEQKDKAEAYLFNKTPTQIDNESQVRVDRQDQIKRWDPRTGQEFNLQDYNPATDPPLNDQNFPRMEGHEGIPYTPWYDQLGGGGDGGMPNIPSTGNDQLDRFIGQYLPW